MKRGDFGAPKNVSGHHFRLVATPAEVELVEDYGYQEEGHQRAWSRARLPLAVWAVVAGDVRDLFNKRLHHAGLAVGDWAEHHAATARGATATTRMERLLGKELAVLLWALEAVPAASAHVALSRWLALRPEERWWLFGMAVADAPWRKALRVAVGAQ
jgi:hypothetical protein